MQPTTDKIFVSYSRHDEAFASKIAIWLANTLNMGVWIDIDDIQPGVKWSAAIQDGLDNCEVMVVIVTPEAMDSINVEDEWQYFIDLGKPVVPILLRSAPVPYQLRRIQWIDFSEKDEYNNSLRQLIVELRQHLKPLDGETTAPAQRRSKKRAVAQSKKSKHSRQRMNKAEDLIEQQSRVLKRTNRIISFLAVLVVLLCIGFGGFFAWVYFNQPAVFYIRGNTAGGFAVLPGEIEAVALASLNGTAPIGTRIQAGSEPLELQSENGQIEAVVQADGIVGITNFTDEEVDLTVSTGNVSVETGGMRGRLAIPNGIDINVDQNIEVEVDPIADTVQTSCFEGNCTVTDTNNGDTVDLQQGQSITFSNSAPNLDEAVIRDIPGEIAYVTNRHGAAELYLMRPDGSNQTRLTSNNRVEDESPAWSPNGRSLAFVSDISGNFEIYTMSPTGEEDPVNITNSFNQDRSPAWSPDGTAIAFVSNRVNGTDDIYIANADGSEVREITNNGGNQSPTWSPDGLQLAFSSTRTGNAEIFILDLTDAEAIPRNITLNPSADSDPSWSPDGTKIAFVSNRDNNLEIYVLDLTTEGAEAVNISLASGRDFEPTWSPNSSRVMFTSERFGNLDIVSASVDVSATATSAVDVIQLTDGTSESDQEAAWLPIIRAGQ